MANVPNRKLTATQLRIIRQKAQKAKSAPVAANDVVETERKQKALPTEAVRIQLDVSSADIVRDVTQGGSDRVVMQDGALKIVAFGEIAAMIDTTKRIDGYCTVRDGTTKIIGYEKDGFVFNEHGDDWAPQTELQAAA